MQLIDTHVHINFDVFESELETVSKRWREAGVVRLVHSCVEPSEFPQIKSLADRFPEISFAVGLHPLDAHIWQPETANEILTLASSDSRVVAIGETGLDFYKADNYQLQKEVFLAQLNLAYQLNLPVIIHCREAALDMAEIIEGFIKENGNICGVMHCWGGTPEEMKMFLNLGFYISFSGTVTFKKATQIQASAAMAPSDRLLIETDCPFLAPVPKRGKRNEPSYVQYVAGAIAEIRGIDVSILAEQTTANACRLFRLSLDNN